MKISLTEMANQVFKRVEGANQSHDTHTFNVLMAIDGKRSVGRIAQEDVYELDDLAAVIEKLAEDGIIEPAMMDAPQLQRKSFFKNLDMHLSKIMGPVGSVIIEDHVSDLGCRMSDYPMNRAHELIQIISGSIPDKAEANNFTRSMTDLLKQTS